MAFYTQKLGFKLVTDQPFGGAAVDRAARGQLGHAVRLLHDRRRAAAREELRRGDGLRRRATTYDELCANGVEFVAPPRSGRGERSRSSRTSTASSSCCRRAHEVTPGVESADAVGRRDCRSCPEEGWLRRALIAIVAIASGVYAAAVVRLMTQETELIFRTANAPADHSRRSPTNRSTCRGRMAHDSSRGKCNGEEGRVEPGRWRHRGCSISTATRRRWRAG